MNKLYNRIKSSKAAMGAVFLLLMLFGAGTWVLAQPGKKSKPVPITDVVAWAAQMAPAETDVLVTLDGTNMPGSKLTSEDIEKLNKALEALGKTLETPFEVKGLLSSEDLDWMDSQVALVGRWSKEDEKAEIVLAIHINDNEKAQLFAEKHLSKMAIATDNGLLCLASSQKALDNFRGEKKYGNLASVAEFVTARQKVRYAKNVFGYAYLKEIAPKAAKALQDALTQSQPQGAFGADDINALLSSLQCIVGGEDYVEGKMLGELFLIADVPNSGSLGQVIFNPSYNIEHPALEQRSANSQVCWATNLAYNYDVLYAMLGMHSLTAALRDYPDMMLSEAGLSIKDNIFGKLLTGSLVASVENFDYAKVISITQKALEQKEAQAAAKKDSEDKAPNPEFGKLASELADQYIKTLSASDWRLSLELQKRETMEKYAEKLPIFRLLLDGAFAGGNSDAKDKQPKAEIARWKFLEFTKVVNNTIWMAGKPENCAPAAEGVATIGQSDCWKALNKMTPSRRAAAEWAVNSQAIQAAMMSGNAEKSSGLSDLAEVMRERGAWQCGRATVIPDGLHICEVVELPSQN